MGGASMTTFVITKDGHVKSAGDLGQAKHREGQRTEHLRDSAVERDEISRAEGWEESSN